MSLGQLSTIIVCQSSGSTESGVCPSGSSPVSIQAYILLPSSQQYFEDSINPIDFEQVSLHFSYAFGLVIAFYVLSKAFGLLYRVVR